MIKKHHPHENTKKNFLIRKFFQTVALQRNAGFSLTDSRHGKKRIGEVHCVGIGFWFRKGEPGSVGFAGESYLYSSSPFPKPK